MQLLSIHGPKLHEVNSLSNQNQELKVYHEDMYSTLTYTHPQMHKQRHMT